MDRQHWQKHAQGNREEGGETWRGESVRGDGGTGVGGREGRREGHLHPVHPTPREEPRQHPVAHWPSPRGEPC